MTFFLRLADDAAKRLMGEVVATVDWSQIKMLGDEYWARQDKDNNGKRKEREARVRNFKWPFVPTGSLQLPYATRDGVRRPTNLLIVRWYYNERSGDCSEDLLSTICL